MEEPEHKRFVTVLRTNDPLRGRFLAAALKQAGLPVQHPGLEHASMLPGFRILDIDLRVPLERAEEARQLIEALEPPVDVVDPMPALDARSGLPYRQAPQRVAFRVPTDRSSLLCGAGLTLAMAVVMMLRPLGLVPVSLIMLGFPIIGYVMGGSFLALTCSGPRCGGRLLRAAEQCPHCGARIVGDIRRHTHHATALEAHLSRDAQDDARQLETNRR